jgi:hypothetical protein
MNTDIQAKVYEMITGKCWHKNKKGHRFAAPHCGKCEKDYTEMDNPRLAKSLDDWAEHIWPVMTEEQRKMYWFHLRDVTSPDSHKANLIAMTFATPEHHLQAAARMLGLEE